MHHDRSGRCAAYFSHIAAAELGDAHSCSRTTCRIAVSGRWAHRTTRRASIWARSVATESAFRRRSGVWWEVSEDAIRIDVIGELEEGHVRDGQVVFDGLDRQRDSSKAPTRLVEEVYDK